MRGSVCAVKYLSVLRGFYFGTEGVDFSPWIMRSLYEVFLCFLGIPSYENLMETSHESWWRFSMRCLKVPESLILLKTLFMCILNFPSHLCMLDTAACWKVASYVIFHCRKGGDLTKAARNLQEALGRVWLGEPGDGSPVFLICTFIVIFVYGKVQW